MTKFKQFYRYDNKKRPILSKASMLEKYEGLYISAPIAVYYKNSVLEFLKKTNKPFFIDPFTFFLNQKLSNIFNQKNQIKKSYKKLITKFLKLSNKEIDELDGEDILLNVGISNNELKLFVKKVLDFQFDCFQPSDVSNFLEKYMKINPTHKIPCKMLTPYVRIAKDDDYAFNKKFIDISQEYESKYNGLPLFAVFCFTKKYLQSNINIGDRIINDFPSIHNFAIWISAYDEDNSKNLNRMNSIKDLIRTLSNNGNNQVLNLSGSHLSVLFSKVGLTDLCSGVSTSNKRTAYISSGGPVGNPIKIYVDKLKKVIPEEDFRQLCEERPDLRCHCEICDNLYTDPALEPHYQVFLKDKGNYLKHFITCRHNEINHIENTSLEALTQELGELEQEVNNPDKTFHLNLWKNDI